MQGPLVANTSGLALVTVVAIACFLVLAVFLAVFGRVFGPWMRAATAGVHIPLAQLVGMRFRRAPIDLIVDTCIRLRMGRVVVPPHLIEWHYHAGGDVGRVAEWLVTARAADLVVTWGQLAKADLAKRLPDPKRLGGEDIERFAAGLQPADD